MRLGHLSPQAQASNMQAEAAQKLQEWVEVVLRQVKNNGGSGTFVRGEWPAHLALNPQIMEIIKDLGYDVTLRERQVTKVKGLIFDSEEVIEEQVTISNPLVVNVDEMNSLAKEKVKAVMREKIKAI